MINKNKTLELLNYINKPMSRENITILYMNNDIKYEKCELFNDFIQSLLILIFDTYMGDDITSPSEQKNHFKWCWNKNVENFKKEGIIIGDYKSYVYFFEFMFDVYYPITKKEEYPSRKNLLKLWAFIFDYNNIKSKSDIDTLIEVYKILNNSIVLN
jgi:hypothetical protein